MKYKNSTAIILSVLGAISCLAQADSTDPTSTSTPGQVPAPAAAAGYNTQTFGPALKLGSDPTAAKLTGNWQPFNFFGATWQKGNIPSNGDGSITIPVNVYDDYGAQLSTAVYSPSAPHHIQGIAFGGGGYFEVTLSFAYNTATGGPAFWANDIESMAGASAGDLTARHWPGQAPDFGDWIEADMAEFDGGLHSDQYGIALHNWYGHGEGTSTLGSGSPVTVPPGTDFKQPHKYGFLWVPATDSAKGYAKWYFDGVQVGNTITWNQYDPTLKPAPEDLGKGGSSAYSIMDTRHLALILGNASPPKTNSATVSPITVYNVSVWQASADKNLSTQ